MHPFRALTLKNFLSFGPEKQHIELGPITVLIGPNGSGKSNLLEAFGLLQSAPEEFGRRVRRSGGFADFLFQSKDKAALAELSVEIDLPSAPEGAPTVHHLQFAASRGAFLIRSENVRLKGHNYPNYLEVSQGKGASVLEQKLSTSTIQDSEFDYSKSGLSAFRHPANYPVLRKLADLYSGIHFFRDTGFGDGLAARGPERSDLPSAPLASNGANLFHVLHRLKEERGLGSRLLEEIQKIYPGINSFVTPLAGGFLDLNLVEDSGARIGSQRLSDGTLRYICLLALLLDPNPAPLICIDEPELGLHPDLMRSLHQLLMEASTRTQLIVATHSEHLIDCFGETPEVVRVFDRGLDGSIVNSVDKDRLSSWLEDYTLGQVWRIGYLGGNRW